MKDAQDLIKINERQKEFYNSKKKNRVTKLWYGLRNGILQDAKKRLSLEKQIKELHIIWFGDLSNKKVLDLGCYAGNSLSVHLAMNSKEYIAIDLSELGISKLSKKLDDIPNARAYVMDFFSDDFKEDGFDLIYAFGVLHHFQDTELLINRLKQKLNQNGEIISYDPLKTSFPVKLARYLYRPFQTDKDWEWPFSKKTYRIYEREFQILDRRAMLGRTKYFFFLNLLPLSAKRRSNILKKWHILDWQRSKVEDKKMFDCMHLTLFMQKI